MTLILWRLNVYIEFYERKFKFHQNGCHFGRHLGFGSFRNKFFEVDLLNIVRYTLSLKISMVYLVCEDGGTNSKTKLLFGAWPSNYKYKGCQLEHWGAVMNPEGEKNAPYIGVHFLTPYI